MYPRLASIQNFPMRVNLVAGLPTFRLQTGWLYSVISSRLGETVIQRDYVLTASSVRAVCPSNRWGWDLDRRGNILQVLTLARTTPLKASRLLMGAEQVTRPNSLQVRWWWWRWWWWWWWWWWWLTKCWKIMLIRVCTYFLYKSHLNMTHDMCVCVCVCVCVYVWEIQRYNANWKNTGS